MEEVKRKRGRPRKVVVEKPPESSDPIDQQLLPAGGEFAVGDVGAWVLGTEIIYFRVTERVVQPNGSVWLKGSQKGDMLSVYLPEDEVRRRRGTSASIAV
jgi:AT hook motif